MPRISDKQRQATRDRILRAAREVFTRNGFHATSMDDLVAAAGMSAGGVYRYFRGKEAIIAAVAEQVVGGLTDTFRSVLDRDPAPSLAEGLREVLQHVDSIADDEGRLALVTWGEAQRDPAVARIAAHEGTQVRAAVLELVRRAQAAGELPADADVEPLSQAVFSLVPGYLLQQRVIGGLEPDRYADAVAVLLGGTATPSRRPRRGRSG